LDVVGVGGEEVGFVFGCWGGELGHGVHLWCLMMLILERVETMLEGEMMGFEQRDLALSARMRSSMLHPSLYGSIYLQTFLTLSHSYIQS
jgi:hypothetical protein